MSEMIIDVENVSKKFVMLKRHYGLKSSLLHLPQYINDIAHPIEFTALSNVSFSLKRGETLGLVGHNGCGKTTLLSIIGGVLKRYQGKVSVRGRISMLLALGAGFCPELSGRENIIMNGVLQGKTRREMERLQDEIIDFADIGDFIDAPMYQYSSGMHMRLGFAVATSIEPEILLVDEVMAVGDVDFTRKCEGRMNQLFANGTTLILVSHNKNDIMKYCKRVIQLDRGGIVFDGLTSELFGEAAV